MVIVHMISSTFANVQKNEIFSCIKNDYAYLCMVIKRKSLTKTLFIMKKIILVAALVLGFAAAAVAQPRAVGLRGGWGVEASYQHTLGANFIQADLGLVGHGITATATYNWMLAQTVESGVFTPVLVQPSVFMATHSALVSLVR